MTPHLYARSDNSKEIVKHLAKRVYELQELGARVTIIHHNYGYTEKVTGYVKLDEHIILKIKSGEDIDPLQYISVMTRKTQWGSYEGYTWVRMFRVDRIESSTKDRRTGTYRKLWEPNPFVLTADGNLDMASSLKDLLGIS